MIIPETFKLMGLEWTVKRDKHIALEGGCYGSTHHSSQTIFLDPANTPLHNEEVFVHEILHTIFWQTGLCKSATFLGKDGRDLEEHIVSALAGALFHVLKDNQLLK